MIVDNDMNTSLMNVSQLATVISLSVFYGLLLLLSAIVYRKSDKQPEPYLWLKVAGYMLLAAFTFRMNEFPLPAGLLIAYMLQRRAALNRKVKQTAILLGALLFLIGLYPLDQRIDRLFFPRNEITTYLHKELIPAEDGFNMTVSDGGGQTFNMVTERDAKGLELYEALLESEGIDEIDHEPGEAVLYLQLHQDHEQDRFRRMQFEVDLQGRYLILQAAGETYYFKTSERFQSLFKTAFPLPVE
ncbi:hypothetical protein [Paenibacillus spongiae]|uniref:Uncharacterized protein n=1 Tax=Paenibacillus spongiae TaxID=2909671 RepID=A0ABY5S5C1_9BACL|nr:hypothetical protein [Paenibacillus spongiae]UVI28859.1 hypothetical protein L1F29_25975 [Paenibacillus spongiae]